MMSIVRATVTADILWVFFFTGGAEAKWCFSHGEIMWFLWELSAPRKHWCPSLLIIPATRKPAFYLLCEEMLISYFLKPNRTLFRRSKIYTALRCPLLQKMWTDTTSWETFNCTPTSWDTVLSTYSINELDVNETKWYLKKFWDRLDLWERKAITSSTFFFFFIVSLAVDVIFQIKILCKRPVTKLLQANKSPE